MKEERFREILKEELSNKDTNIDAMVIFNYIKELEDRNKELTNINKELELKIQELNKLTSNSDVYLINKKITDYKEYKLKFGIKLTNISKSKNISVSAMAKKLDVPLSTACDWYRGVNFPKLDKLYSIAHILEIPVEDLIKID